MIKFDKYKKSIKAKCKKPIFKAKRMRDKVLNNIDDYYEDERKAALKYKRRGKIKL